MCHSGVDGTLLLANEYQVIQTELHNEQKIDRATRWLLVAIGVYSIVFVGFLNLAVLNGGNTRDRAIVGMADGMILLWILVGGSLTPILRKRLAPHLTAVPIGWQTRFMILCTMMALIEEVITTSMTNLAPLFGTTPQEAHITASTNYFTVVLFHSVVVFVPMFAAWAWMLARWDFSPLQVLLLFGITGSLAEASINPTSLLGGFWVFVYGLMVYLPACTVPQNRGAKPLRWWHYPMAILLPLLAAIPVVPVVIWLRQWLDVQFFLSSGESQKKNALVRAASTRGCEIKKPGVGMADLRGTARFVRHNPYARLACDF